MHESDDLNSYVVFYGSLMRQFSILDQLGLRDRTRFVCRCELAGNLHDLGDYPGLTAGDGIVKGELFQTLDPAVLAILDEYEECVPGDDAASLYLRRQLPLIRPEQTAWVYVYNAPVSASTLIASGDWSAFAAG